MAAPQSTPLSPAPGPNDPGEVFDAKAFQFTSELEPLRQELQAQADYIDDGVAAVEDATSSAIQQTNNALTGALSAESGAQSAQFATEAAASVAIASANFKGRWSDLTGALSIPASVEHDGYFWMLLSNVVDVAAKTPGVASEWKIIVSETVRERLLSKATLISDFANSRYELYEGPTKGMQSKTFAQMWDFTRGTTATARNATGGVDDVAVDEPRFVGNREGLLIEEQRTNLLVNSENHSSTNGVTYDGQSPYPAFIGVARKYTKTQDGYGVRYGAPAGPGGTGIKASSVYIRADDGKSVTVKIDAEDKNPTEFTVGDSWKRINSSGEGGSFSNFFDVEIRSPVGSSIHLCAAQLEKGSNPSTYIKAEGTQVTRQADNCSRSLGREFNSAGSTVIFEYVPEYIGGSVGLLSIYNKSAGFTASRSYSFVQVSTGKIDVAVGGSYVQPQGSPIVSVGEITKVAITRKNGEYLFAQNGKIYSLTGAGTYSGELDEIIAGNWSDFFLGGSLPRITIIPEGVTASELEALTA